MANKTVENPWIIDTPSAVVIFTHNMKIIQFEFIDYVNDTDTAEVQNQNGLTVWKANGASDMSPVRSGRIGWINGLIVPSIINGKVLVWFE